MPETDSQITDVKLLFSVTLLAGEILLSSGAEIYREEDTISRLLALSGYAGGESFVTPSCILLTLRTPDSEAMTTLKRVPVRENNLSRVAETNTVAKGRVTRDIIAAPEGDGQAATTVIPSA